ncbi:MAG: RNA 2',3'-cyclic phosphodiesterase [Bifidobacteriaceae bacterium]|nr:RNA 2',3'-cyclic phosphodiesterase [Bifidobacteriaceae bacterium]
MRLFTAIVPHRVALDHLTFALEQVLPNTTAISRTLAPRENWHLTCAFYGEVGEGSLEVLTESLTDLAAATPAPELALAGAGRFRGLIAWIGVANQTDLLSNLMQKANQLLGSDQPKPSHARRHQQPAAAPRAHLTISRHANAPGWAEAIRALSVYRGPAWQATELVLMRSELGKGRAGHPLYTPIHHAPFADLPQPGTTPTNQPPVL